MKYGLWVNILACGNPVVPVLTVEKSYSVALSFHLYEKSVDILDCVYFLPVLCSIALCVSYVNTVLLRLLSFRLSPESG